MTDPEVVVIIRCRDQGRTLDEAVQSVRGQTRQPVELVIVDHEAVDLYTRQVLARLEQGGLRILRSTHQSLAKAWNLGIRSTLAPFIVLLEGDRRLEPTYLEKASNCLALRTDIAFVSFPMRRSGGANEHRDPGSPELIASIARESISVSSMFRRDAWVEVGGFDEHCRGSEELDFWTSLLERGFRGETLPEPLLCGRGSRSVGIDRETRVAAMERFYRKHMNTVTGHVEPLLLAKEQVLLELTEHHELLHNRKGALRADLEGVQRDIAAALAEFRGLGQNPIELGDLRRTSPISPVWGLDRGLPLDRYYIESFLDRNRNDVRGRVLEVKDAGYTRRFGDSRVTGSDVLDIDVENRQATVLADLTQANGIADDTYDCFVLTQVLGLIYDVSAAVATAYRILKPGGVLLCTVPAAGRISYEGSGLDGDYWRFTEASIRRLFAEAFPIDGFEVTGFGNVLATAAFLYGLAPHELARDELDSTDPFFPLVYGIRATKPFAPIDARAAGVDASHRRDRSNSMSAILAYHRIAEARHDGNVLCVAPENFRAHMQQLREQGYNVISLRDMAGAIRSGNVPDRSVAITLDDGHSEALTASKMLTGLSIPATYFIVAEALDGQREFWWDTLDRVFKSDRPLGSSLAIDTPTGPLELHTSTRQERSLAYARLTRALYGLSRTERDRVIDRVVAWSGVAPPAAGDARPMTSEELEHLAAVPGGDIGAHTANHVWLPAETRDVQIREICSSKLRLERLLGQRITSFAYPYGAHDEATVEVVEQAGFQQAVTTEERAVTARDNCFLLPRCEIRDCDGEVFADRLRRLFERASDSRRVSHETLS